VGSFVLRASLAALGYRIGESFLIGDSTSAMTREFALAGAIIATLIDGLAFGWERR
jgi:hypothetical protein